MNKRKKYFQEIRFKVWDMDGRTITDEQGDFPKIRRTLKNLEEKYR